MRCPLTQAERRNLLERLVQSGLQISPDALDYVLSLEAPSLAVDSIITGRTKTAYPSVLSRIFIEKLLSGDPQESESSLEQLESYQIEEFPGPIDQGPSEEQDWPIRILKNPDKASVGSEGSVDDFLALFTDRYKRIKRIYAGRMDTQGALSPAVAKTKTSDSLRFESLAKRGQRRKKPPNLNVIGIVKSKNISRSQNIILEIEDSEGTIICVVPTGTKGLKGQQLSEKANSVLLDEIVCVSGYVDRDGRMIANDVIFPDIPTTKEVGRARRDVYAVFISDLHCGSNEFLEDEFDRLIDWIRGRDVDAADKNMVNRIQYIFIAGDLVDGVGVYPEQRGDLAIPSIYEQYALLADKLRNLPDGIKILCIPGNHDACRQALPRPPIPKEFAPSLYGLGDRIMMFGDPCQIVVEGVNVILTHGDSLDDLVTNIPGASYKEPAIPMKSLLQKRHLAPLFGGKTELAPLHRDWMVIETPPDIIHFGHAHHNAVDVHRGVQIINSGTFQSQTDFMRKQGIVPTPGIVTLVNLRTGAPELKFFYDMVGQ